MAGAETCRQFKIKTTNKLSSVLTHLKTSPYFITKRNWDDTSKDFRCQSRPHPRALEHKEGTIQL